MASGRLARAILVSAEKVVWEGEAKLVVARTLEGEIGIMVGHEPLLAALQPAVVRITDAAGQVHSFNNSRGFLSVTADKVEVVCGTMVPVDPDAPEAKETDEELAVEAA